MNSFSRRAFVLFFGFVFLKCEGAQDTLVPAIITFGDSAVDVGNNDYLPTIFKANYPPYGRDFVNHRPTGRFCNGKLATDITAETLGFKSYAPAYLSPQASGKNLLIGANFASAASGYDEKAAILNHAIPLSQQLSYYKKYQGKLARVSGSLPKRLREKNDDNKFRFAGNPNLCEKHSCRSKFLIPGIIAGIIVSIVITIIWSLARKKQAARKNEQLKSKNQVFSYAEILSITDNFKTIIGKGGFGNVYLGVLQDFTQVAVKLLSKSSMQGYREFQSEAQLLMIVHHKNLVPLIGYCDEGDIKALVYEYMIMGNLQQQLSDKNPDVLSSRKRLQIALDAAHGLDYLHNGCKPPIVHRDLKPSNILLNEDMQAKIADFGLSKAFTSTNDTHISTRPAGTVGYLDPEFHKIGNLTKRSDVYSFGIILLELLTGQQAVIEAPSGNAEHILQWIIPRLESRNIQSTVDPRLQGMFNPASAWKFIDVAMSCTPSNAIERPDISQVLLELKECLVLEIATESAPSSSKSSIKSLGTSLPESEIGSHGKQATTS